MNSEWKKIAHNSMKKGFLYALIYHSFIFLFIRMQKKYFHTTGRKNVENVFFLISNKYEKCAHKFYIKFNIPLKSFPFSTFFNIENWVGVEKFISKAFEGFFLTNIL